MTEQTSIVNIYEVAFDTTETPNPFARRMPLMYKDISGNYTTNFTASCCVIATGLEDAIAKARLHLVKSGRHLAEATKCTCLRSGVVL